MSEGSRNPRPPQGPPSIEQQQTLLAAIRAEHVRLLGPLAPKALRTTAALHAERLGSKSQAEYEAGFAESIPLVSKVESDREGFVALTVLFISQTGEPLACPIGYVESLEPDTLLQTRFMVAEAFDESDLDTIYPLAHQLEALRVGTDQEPARLPNLDPAFIMIQP